MSEREKEIIKKLSNTVPKLDKDKQNYILGVAEGMVIARETEHHEIKNRNKIMEKGAVINE